MTESDVPAVPREHTPESPTVEAPAPSIAEFVDQNAAQVLEQCSSFGLAFLLVRRGGAIIDANERALALLGCGVEELRSLADISLLLPPDQRSIRAEYRQMHRRQVTPSGSTRVNIVRADGQQIPIEVVFVPIDGGLHTILAFRDVSDVADRDQLINWYGALCERMPIGVMIARRVDTADGPRLQLLSANAAASESFSMDLKQRIGDVLASIFPEQVTGEDRQRIMALLGTGGVSYLPDTVIGDPSAPDRVFRRLLVALPDDAVAMVIEDVTRMINDDLHRRALLERIVELGDADRRQIALGIHDDPLQQIAGAALLVAQLRRRDRPLEEDWLADVDDALHRSMDALRRLVFDLSPPELVESGLSTALSKAADHLFAGDDVRVHVDQHNEANLPDILADTAFRIAVEALTNVRKHARATVVNVRIRTDADALRVDIVDNGRGFSGTAPLGHFGFANMRDRAEAVGGSCGITTGVGGTTVRVALPLASFPATRTPELTSTIRELDIERATIANERDGLRRALEDTRRLAESSRQRLHVVAELGEVLRSVSPHLSVRAAAACRHICTSVFDGAAVRMASGDGAVLNRVASWHRDPAQLAFLDRFLFVDRSNDTSNAHLVFRTGEPMLIDRSNGWWAGDGPQPPEGPVSVHSAILVPISVAERTIGVLTVCRDATPMPFDSIDISVLRAASYVLGAHLSIGTETSI